MKAGIEILSGIIRVGKEGQQFDFAVAFSASEGVAELKALSVRGITTRHARAIGKALMAAGLRPVWRRPNNERIRGPKSIRFNNEKD